MRKETLVITQKRYFIIIKIRTKMKFIRKQKKYFAVFRKQGFHWRRRRRSSVDDVEGMKVKEWNCVETQQETKGNLRDLYGMMERRNVRLLCFDIMAHYEIIVSSFR